MKLKVDFNEVTLLGDSKRAKKEPKRKVLSTPTLKVTKKGILTMNKAFFERYYAKRPKDLYFKVGLYENSYLIFVSPTEQENFDRIFHLSKAGIYQGCCKVIGQKIVGKNGKDKYFELVPVTVKGIKLKGFKLQSLTDGHQTKQQKSERKAETGEPTEEE